MPGKAGMPPDLGGANVKPPDAINNEAAERRSPAVLEAEAERPEPRFDAMCEIE